MFAFETTLNLHLHQRPLSKNKSELENRGSTCSESYWKLHLKCRMLIILLEVIS